MQSRFSLAAIFSLLAIANARIVGFSVPRSVKAGDEIKIKATSTPVTPSDWEIGIGIGIADVSSAAPGSIGKPIKYYSVEYDDQNRAGPLYAKLTFPSDLANGEYVLTIVELSTRGEASVPTLSEFRLNMNIGDATSDNWVESAP